MRISSRMEAPTAAVTEKYVMSYVKKSFTSEPQKKAIPDFIRHWSEVKPTANAFVFLSSNGDRETITWRELYEKSVQYSKAFINLGVKKGDVVGITVPSSPKWLYVAFGASFAGAIPAGIAFTYKDGSDVIALLNKIASCSTFVLDPVNDVTTWRIFQTFLSSYSKDGRAESKVVPSLRYVISVSSEISEPGILTLDELIQLPRDDVELPVVKPEDIALLFQTSGSTGVPKVIAHAHTSFSIVAGSSSAKDFMQENQVVYNDRPFSWGGGWPISIFNGGTRVLRSGLSEEPADLAQFAIDVIKKERCTTLVALPPQLHGIIAAISENDASSQKVIVPSIAVGGQPINRSLASDAKRLCKNLCIGYGTTECILVAMKVLTDGCDYQENCSGSVAEGVELKVVNEDGDVVPVGMRGELHVRGPTMFIGYFNDAEKTRAVLSDDGWYKTDDIGFLTEDGELYVEGRKSDIILCGGFNVLPGVLESVIQAMPGVRDAVIVPIPDETYFQVLCACVILSTGSDVTEEKLRKYCEDLHNDKAQVYSVLPTYYLFFDKFPETISGKTKRKDLAIEALQRLTLK